MSNSRSKAKSKNKVSIPRYRPNRPSLFGPPPLLVGEDAAAYDELRAAISATVEPIDTVEKMFVADVVFLEWDVLRWRRLKSSLIRGYQVEALKEFLSEKLELHYSLYAQEFAAELAATLEDNLPEDQAHTAKQLADACGRDEAEANDRVNKILAGSQLSIDDILDSARQHKAEELAQKYGRREPDALTLVDEILTEAGVSLDDLVAEKLVEKLVVLEQIDRLTANVENRRNTMLREIDRRRTVIGEALRRSIKEVEDAEFQVVDPTPAKRKTAA
jgi:hypothetical protein